MKLVLPLESTNWPTPFNFKLTVSTAPLSLSVTCTLPPELSTACPLASNTTLAATVLPVVVVLNKVAPLGEPLAIETFGVSVNAVYSVAVDVFEPALTPFASVTLDVMVKLFPLPGAASANVMVPVAGL